MLAAAIALAACAPQAPAVAPVYVEAEDGPKLAPWLHLTPEQNHRVIALVDEVKRSVEPVEPAAMNLAEGVALAVRGCRKDSTLLEMRADSLVMAGEAAREPILDAIDELHAILTPKQRRRLVRHVLERERTSTPERRQEDADERTTSVGLELDLSWRQIASMLVRIRKIQSVYEEEAEPWLERYRIAVEAFAEPDFHVRDHAIARAPVMRMIADLVTDAYRVLVPLLEEEQCAAVSTYLKAKLAEVKAKREAEAKEKAATERATLHEPSPKALPAPPK